MNVNEFAEQIVFGKTLEEKLKTPGTLSFETQKNKIANVESLVSPGRASELRMRHDKGGNVQPPSDSSLENEQARGQLLHFLANHELLATELMALVLLKFPNAPIAFRQGVLATLREEQAHTQMYLRRMEQCGIEFGSFPLSGQFWRLVEPMKSPIDFVARLSLTFEQANLDYSLHFANVFQKIGDDATAQLLQQIYQDEIGHVQHGLHWFRQWKNPEQSDWEAYQESLPFPMSPQRGRGPRGAFNRDGRKQAGLSDAFINAIEVFRQSRGRAPTVRWFDAAAESELAGATSESSLLAQLGRDLESVMLAMAKEDDVVLVRSMPSESLRKHWIDAGFDLPEFVPFDERERLSDRKLHDFAPWAWTPNNCDSIQSLVSSAHVSPPVWHEDYREDYRDWSKLYRKSWCVEHLQQSASKPDYFADSSTTGIVIRDETEIPIALTEIAARGFDFAIFKRDLSTSGRGQRRLACKADLSQQDNDWLQYTFSKSATNKSNAPVGVVEPELDRLLDLSFLWHLSANQNEPNFLGWTRPTVSRGRRYTGTRFGSVFHDCDEQLRRFLLTDRCAKIEAVVNCIEERITTKLIDHDFVGYFGVDAFVYRNADSDFKIKPIVELNPRMTMGHIALRLEKRLAPGTEAEFRVFTKNEWDAVASKLDDIPLEVTNDRRWKSGVIRFGDFDVRTKLFPVMLVGARNL